MTISILKLPVLLCVTAWLCSQPTSGLYEDQIGKFDWRISLVGPVKYSIFNGGTSSSRKQPNPTLFVATEENVVAALSANTGDIIWRKILEKGDAGTIKTLHLSNGIIFSVSGIGVIIVRGWDAKRGSLTYQWSMQLESQSEEQTIPKIDHWFCNGNRVYQFISYESQVSRLTAFRISDGEKIFEKNIPFIDAVSCAASSSNALLLCSSAFSGLSVMNLADKNPSFQQLNYNTDYDTSMDDVNKVHSLYAPWNLQNAVFVVDTATERWSIFIDRDLVAYRSKNVDDNSDIYALKLASDSSSFTIETKLISETILELRGYRKNESRTGFSRRITLKYPISKHRISNANCEELASSHVFCSVLIASRDGSLVLVQSTGELLWSREEGLANIVTSEMIELPMSETDIEMQTEFDEDESDVWKMFTRRIASHAFQLQKMISSLSEIIEKPFVKDSNVKMNFVRDYFNLHKIILAVTKHLKVYAIDNVSKNILWSRLIGDDYEPFAAPCANCDAPIPLFVQRTYRHYPHPMQCSLLFQQKSNKNGVILSFNPVTGQFVDLVKLNFRIKQASLLPKPNPYDHLLGIALLGQTNEISVYPESCKPSLLELGHQIFMYVADAEKCEVVGYTFGSDINDEKFIPAWNMKCTGKIVKIAGKNPIEKVHSQGRVLADRSVLYKYINPNLIVVVSQSINPEDKKSMLTLYFVDSITGVIVNGDVRHRASEPIHLVHSENWIVLIYFNEKSRRTEVVTYELYEGKEQQNSTAFSSIRTKSLRPIVDSRAYILPTSGVEAARETITEKGITSKHVLVALSTGSVVELPWVILDPRRPFAATVESREEGVIPYVPEIPIPNETIINYNLTLNRIRNIISSPSGLESTSLIFAYGLDLFVTRSAPSKTFDLLKEDFDYVIIVIVLTLLIVLTIFTKHLAYQKALRLAWR